MTNLSYSIWHRPATKLGWWAVGLALGYFVLMPLWSFMGPLGAWPAFLCGAAGGVCGLIAITRQHERSWLVWLTVLPLALVLFFFVGEFAFPH